jgi:uncharacterized membrane protein
MDEQMNNNNQGNSDEKVMAILAYIIFFIPLIAGAHKKSEFGRFHANQGTVLWVACIIYNVVYSILATVLWILPVLGPLLIVVLGFVPIGFLVLVIMGIVNAANLEMKELPIIGKYTIIK